MRHYAELTNAERARAWAAALADDPDGEPLGFRAWTAEHPVGGPPRWADPEATPYSIAYLLGREAARRAAREAAGR